MYKQYSNTNLPLLIQNHFAQWLLIIIIGVTSLLSACHKSQLTKTPLEQANVNTAELDAPNSKLNPPAALDPDNINDTPVKLEKPVTNTDLWERIRTGFSIPEQSNARIETHVRWFLKHPEYLERVALRAKPFLHFIVEEIEQKNLPTELALLPIVESAFKPFAYSHGSAAGIWQFIPSTGRAYGLKQNWWYDGRRDIYASTQAALTYLSELNRQLESDWLYALAAYNAGAGNVRKGIRHNRAKNRPLDYWHLKLPRETQNYIPKLLALKRIVSHPEQYGITLHAIEDKPVITKVSLEGQLDLAKAAELANMSMDELYQFNPGFNQWATDPNGPHYLLLPLEIETSFKSKELQLPTEERVLWKRHQIREGETLSHIAEKYMTSIKLIKDVNKLKTHNIRAGKYLLIPSSNKSLDYYSLSAKQRQLDQQNAHREGIKGFHTVKKGDTWWDISQQYKVSLKKLAHWNGMSPKDTLQPGQKLIYWQKQAHNDTNKTGLIAPKPHTPIEKIQKVKYRVKPGDSLDRIANRFRVNIADLQRWNTSAKNKYLQPGQLLNIYVDVTKQI